MMPWLRLAAPLLSMSLAKAGWLGPSRILRAPTRSSRMVALDLHGGASDRTHFDLIVIGGGSGGLACAREAARLGAKVCVLDYVKPSPHGSVWGIGGTCVNVGCIPKKLMHHAAKLSSKLNDAAAFGWMPATIAMKASSSNGGKIDLISLKEEPSLSHDVKWAHHWPVLSAAVQGHIKMLNFKYGASLRSEQVEYINDLGRFVDEVISPHSLNIHNTIELVQAASAAAALPGSSTSAAGSAESRTQLTAGAFVVAVGGRPSPLRCAGGEVAVSSDDLFGLPSLVSARNVAAQASVARGDRRPKVCVVGGGYVALECGGLLAGLGCDVTVLYRSQLLRGFDRDCVARVSAGLEADGVKLVQGTPRCIQQIPLTDDKSSQKGASKEEQESNAKDGEYTVQWASEQQQQQGEEQFDLVLAAVGRAADTTGLNLQAAGVKTTGIGAKAAAPDGSSSSGGGGGDVVLVGPPGTAATANSKVFAIGDVAQGTPQLTPVAVLQGQKLARRLFGGSRQRKKGLRQDGSVGAATVGGNEGSKAPSLDRAKGTLIPFESVATAIFTPLEYACVGLSEEAALAKCDASNDEEELRAVKADQSGVKKPQPPRWSIRAHHLSFTPLEASLPLEAGHVVGADAEGYVKVVVMHDNRVANDDGDSENDDDDGDDSLDEEDGGGPSRDTREVVVGVHYVGPHAGEVIQGFAVAMSGRSPLTWRQLRNSVGVHPTSAEELVRVAHKGAATRAVEDAAPAEAGC